MITVSVVNLDGQQVGTLEIDPADFGGEVNKQLLHDLVIMYQANQRLGTAKTKTRAEVAGSGKKLYRQKGTGNARSGPRRTPVRVGGGTAFGPKPRDYWYSVPKKARRMGARMAFLSKFLDNEAVVVDGLKMSEPKTKQVAQTLVKLGLGGKSCLIATGADDRNVYLSGRNIHGVDVKQAQEVNAYDLLRHKNLLITKEAIELVRNAGAPVDNG